MKEECFVRYCDCVCSILNLVLADTDIITEIIYDVCKCKLR